jgi:uncharacterized protein YjiS (DUF1127 family)
MTWMEKIRNACNILENLKRERQLGDIGIDGRTILKWVL